MHFITESLSANTAMIIWSWGWFQLLNLRCFPIIPTLALEQPVCGLLEGSLRDQNWELHHTVNKVTDTPATYSFGHVVGLAAFDMVQPWAELDVAGVHGLVICKLDGCHFPIAFVLMLDLLYSVLQSRVACLWIGP